MRHKPALGLLCLFVSLSSGASAQSRVPPYDLWTDDVLTRILDRSTLEYTVAPSGPFFGVVSYEVYFTSNPSADYFDSQPPYAEHNGEKIRIHGYLSVPASGGPYPALVLGHGHGGESSLTFAQQLALLGYVALSIDGPRAGKSTGGPEDDNQAWISVDKGSQYSYLYHYGYAGMRALTLFEELASQPSNPYRIDPNKLGALGPSMGGIFTTYLNGIDSRMKFAVVLASAGNWAHTLRYPDSWLYHGLYTDTRDLPYNGSDPLNSIEDIDRDPTAITFLNHFDPIRYARRQYAPVLTIIGTHDEYFPLPNPNLMLQAITSAGTQTNFEKRLWLIPNGPHDFTQTISLFALSTPMKQFINYAVGSGPKPLATPKVVMSDTGFGLRFEISLAETSTRLSGAKASLWAATRVDSTKSPITDFREYQSTAEGNLFISQIPAGEKSLSGDTITAANVIYFATVTDAGELPVSSLVRKGELPMDLSTDFTPVIDQWPGDATVAPVPPPAPEAANTISSSIPIATGGYQGIALSNPTDHQNAVRVEARTQDGRIAAAEGLINPIYLSLPAHAQQVFVNEEWFGSGTLLLDGSLRAVWTDPPAASLSFRGAVGPSQLVEIGPATAPATSLWLALAPEQDPAATRVIRIFGGADDAEVQVVYRNAAGSTEAAPSVLVTVPAHGTVDLPVPAGPQRVSAEIQATNPVSARLEVSGTQDPWSIEARTVPAATRYFQPHTELNGTYTTRLLFLNSSGAVRRIQPHLRSREGIETGTATPFSLDPHALAGYTVESLFGIGSGAAGVGWIDIDAPDGPVVIVALAAAAQTGATASSAMDAGGAGSWSMPYYVEAAGYWTGLAIANVGSTSTDIVISAWDHGGNLVKESPTSLAAQNSKTQLVSQWIQGLPPGTSGHITITSTGPIALLAYFGTNDGAAFAAIPFTLVSP